MKKNIAKIVQDNTSGSILKDYYSYTVGRERPFYTMLYPSGAGPEIFCGTESKLNKDNYRSDEFSEMHEGEHVLFAGCSVTLGNGLSLEELWSYKLYKKISKNKKTSGYFNVAMSGFSILDTISNIFAYIQKYGGPNAVFINLPPITRNFEYYEGNYYTKVWFSDYKEEFKEEIYHDAQLAKIYIYHYYSFLEQYCNSLGIKLYSFSWKADGLFDNNNIFEEFNFKTYYKILLKDTHAHTYNYQLENPHDTNYLIARDNHHVGTGFHDHWAEVMYNVYERNGNFK